MPDQMLSSLVDYSQGGDFSGLNFSERYFVAVIRNAVKWFSENPEAWKRIIGNVSAEELARFQQYFENRKPAVRLGYARTNDAMPMINVILENETSAVDLVGDLGGVGEMNEFTLPTGGVINSNLRRQTVSIHVHADHPEVTLYLYHMVQSSILSSAKFFAEKNLANLSFVSGTEVLPQEVYLPEQIYSRVLSYTFEEPVRAQYHCLLPPEGLYIFVQGVKVSDTIQGGVTISRT